MRRAVLLAPAVLAVALMAPGGCGGSSTNNHSKFTGTEKNVAQAVDDIVSRAGKAESRQICDGYLTVALKARLAALAKQTGRGSDCSDQLKDSLRDIDVFDAKIQPRGIRVSGRTATVTVKFKTSAKTDPVGTLKMVDQRGWRVAELP